ncbi:Uncharacterised protein [Klebsiella pneumoniae]|uniref:Uncharacterized protein n=1 Tax=Klebsiella pneumoniae TaxID=573 RepID=A0A447RJF1_KLEPN|nr:Uncharacterised protein [Klebsiella pneumoniae]
MISNIDYMKLAMSYENDKTEIDPVLRSRVWGVVLVGLAMFWSINRAHHLQHLDCQLKL